MEFLKLVRIKFITIKQYKLDRITVKFAFVMRRHNVIHSSHPATVKGLVGSFMLDA
jgi:hypothetical protein